jgi:hypothetical protein
VSDVWNEERIRDLQELCDRHGWDCKSWHKSLDKLTSGIEITVEGAVLRSESGDSFTVVLARMETALMALGRAKSDTYLTAPPDHFGRL